MDSENDISHLLDLPNELLNIIFDSLSSLDIFALARTNRALNAWLIPRLLPSSISEDSTNIRTYTDFLSPTPSIFDVLSVALTFNSITIIDHRFDWKQESIFAEMRCLTWLLRRLKGIESLRLDFTSCTLCQNGSDAKLQLWADLYGRLLNLALVKGCQVLCIDEGNIMASAYSLEEIYFPAPPRRLDLWSRLKSSILSPRGGSKMRVKDEATLPPLSAKNCKYVRVRGQLYTEVTLSPEAQAASSLTTLTLNGPIPFVPPCSTWTFSVLSTTTSLKAFMLSDINLPLYHWTYSFHDIFTDAVIRHLTQLSIAKCEFIPVDCLLKALSGMRRLTHLSLDFYISCVSSVTSQEMEKIPQLELSELLSLNAPSDFVQHFLQITSDGHYASDALPKLRQVHVLLRTDKFHVFNYFGDAGTLSPIWTALMSRQLDATLSVRITHPYAMRLDGVRGAHPPIYDQVTSLQTLSGDRTFMGAPDLSTWFAGFPALEHMAFENWMFSQPTSFEDILAHCSECPNLKTLRIGQKVHEIR